MTKEMSLVVWEKWSDPFGEALEEAKWTDYDNQIEDLEDIDLIEEEELIQKQIKAIATPMGIIPYNELTSPAKLFNFWVGHTNFDITPKVVSTIETTPGVEILDIFTRYRFRVGIGKCFSDSETMKLINDKLYQAIK